MNYIETLEKVSKSELINTLFYAFILAVVAIAIWIINYLYFKKRFKASNKPSHLNSLKKSYKSSLKACSVLSVVFFVIIALFVWVGCHSIDEINKDIKENSFEIYNGEYYIEYDFNSKSYPKYLDVYLENGDIIYVYNRNFIEYLLTNNGAHSGRVVYGKNSLIVVEMENTVDG